MAEQRLIDATSLKILFEHEYRHNKQFKQSSAYKAWQGAIQLLYDQPTIDPESLPIVRQLREELAREKRLCDDLQKDLAITANERDAALDRVRHYAGCWECKTREEGNCAMPFCKDGCSGWKWRGPQKEG